MLDARKSLLGLLAKYVSIDGITDDTELYRDLGISGDDADEFFRDFVKLFGISGPGQFAFNDYFPSEGEYVSFAKLLGLKDKSWT